MKFKNKEDYISQRKALIDKAQQFINDGKLDESEVIMQEVTDLDNEFEKFTKIQANINALNGGVSNVANVAIVKTGNVYGKVVDAMKNNNIIDVVDMYDSTEYRKAFMNHVLSGASIPTELVNADANTKTSDVGAVIPTTVIARIIEKMDAIGMILPLVTKTSYKGGVSIPTSSVKPTASWVAEGAGSDRQKKTTGSITFSYYKLRCAISVSLETDTMALAVFETTFVNNVADAMTKAVEQSIMTGTGSGQPKGFLTETPVTGQAIQIAKATAIDYTTLVNAEAALPLAYENNAVWFMTKKTFMSFIGLVDSSKQPIARVNYGIAGRPERTLLGRTVILNDYMTNYDATGATTHIFAALFDPSQYILNTNLNITVKQFEDNNTDDIVRKAIMLVDGKTVDINSLVTLTKMNA